MTFKERYGHWAVIAGASEGTGAAFARAIAAQGVNCILVARSTEKLNALADELRQASGIDCMTLSADLAAPDAAGQIIAAAGTREVGLLIANAGADTNGANFLDAGIERWTELLNLNAVTTMKLCHHFGQQMCARKRGGIILIGTGASYGGMRSLAIYAGAKAFLLCFGESLWSELRAYDVHILNLMLGRTDTPAFRRALESKGLPIPAQLAKPEDVAAKGLEQLPHGPVYNWGLADDQSGFAPTSAAARRARIAAMEEAAKAVMGK